MRDEIKKYDNRATVDWAKDSAQGQVLTFYILLNYIPWYVLYHWTGRIRPWAPLALGEHVFTAEEDDRSGDALAIDEGPGSSVACAVALE